MSGRPHYFTKRDANQAEIADGLRQMGFCVLDVSPLGGDALDMFVGGWSCKLKEYAWVQVEVKTPTGNLTNDEETYIAQWLELPIVIARSTEDVLDWFGRNGNNGAT
jgi:hypothetical protein